MLAGLEGMDSTLRLHCAYRAVARHRQGIRFWWGKTRLPAG